MNQSAEYHLRIIASGLAADIRCSDMDKLLAVLREHLLEIDQLRNLL